MGHATGGVTNPLVRPPVDGINSDPALLYDQASDRLVITYREVSGGLNHIKGLARATGSRGAAHAPCSASHSTGPWVKLCCSLARSPDGEVWTTYPGPFLRRGFSNWSEASLYRSSALFTPSSDHLTVWLSARSKSGEWSLGLVQYRFTDFIRSLGQQPAG